MGSKSNHDTTFYTIQHKLVAENIWGKPETALRTPVKRRLDKGWTFSSFDHFEALNPYTGRESIRSMEHYAVWSESGHNGWRSKRYAREALARMRKADAAGKHDRLDQYTDKIMQRQIHEFRIVKCTSTFNAEAV